MRASETIQLGRTACVMNGHITRKAPLAKRKLQRALASGSALWALADENTVNQTATAEQSGAVSALVALLSTNAADVQREAAGALWSLAQRLPANQNLVMRAGAVTFRLRCRRMSMRTNISSRRDCHHRQRSCRQSRHHYPRGRRRVRAGRQRRRPSRRPCP